MNITYFINTVKASFSRRSVVLNFYFCWAFLSIILLGALGIVPFVLHIVSTFKLVNDIKQTETRIERNTYALQGERTLIADNSNVVSILDTSIPQNIDIQNFMLDFVSVASTGGYNVTFLAPDTVNIKDGVIPVSVKVSGTGTPADLLKSLSQLKRLCNIKEFNADAVGGGYEIALQVDIYTKVK
jgi:hypothetical protein